jgi:hypothetical protein
MIASMTAAAPSKPERPVLSPGQIEKIATSIVTAGLVAIVIKPFRTISESPYGASQAAAGGENPVATIDKSG